MIVLGIDPGYGRMGVAVVEKNDSGKETLLFSECVETPASKSFHERLLFLGERLERVLKKWKPDAAALEKLFITKNQKTAMSVSEARGTIAYIIAKSGIPVFEMTPNEIKTAITGYGSADKKQVEMMVKNILGKKTFFKYDDECDAVAAAITLLSTGKRVLQK